MRTALKPVALQLALVAMVLRALLPAGWMPAAITSANASPFVICTMDGPLHAPGKPAHAPDQDRADHPCVFAAAAHLSPPLAAPVSLAPSSATAPVLYPRSPSAIAASATHRPNAARAPPASV
ncbi:MAG TPA: hypothetical protein VMF58_16540 [Rhizomicrobium sp.]|nr:hypothetical protein [Rhizomicrobium sp.]